MCLLGMFRVEQNGRYFLEHTFKCILLNECSVFWLHFYGSISPEPKLQWIHVITCHEGSIPANTRRLDPDSKVHGAYMGPTWGRQGPGGPHVGPMNLAIRGGRLLQRVREEYQPEIPLISGYFSWLKQNYRKKICTKCFILGIIDQNYTFLQTNVSSTE